MIWEVLDILKNNYERFIQINIKLNLGKLPLLRLFFPKKWKNDIEFLHTPGHTPGSQCFKVNNNLVSGDTLFVQGCGRVDLPGSNSEDMFHSLRKLSSLPDETILYPGHHYSPQESETMEKVKEINSYLRIEELELWKRIM